MADREVGNLKVGWRTGVLRDFIRQYSYIGLKNVRHAENFTTTDLQNWNWPRRLGMLI